MEITKESQVNIPAHPCTQEVEEFHTPLKLQRLHMYRGKAILTPISIQEALSQSAKRVKVLPNGKEILDTTALEDKLRRITQTEVKGKETAKLWLEQIEAEKFKIKEEPVKLMKRKPQDKSKSLRKPRSFKTFDGFL